MLFKAKVPLFISKDNRVYASTHHSGAGTLHFHSIHHGISVRESDEPWNLEMLWASWMAENQAKLSMGLWQSRVQLWWDLESIQYCQHKEPWPELSARQSIAHGCTNRNPGCTARNGNLQVPEKEDWSWPDWLDEAKGPCRTKQRSTWMITRVGHKTFLKSTQYKKSLSKSRWQQKLWYKQWYEYSVSTLCSTKCL